MEKSVLIIGGGIAGINSAIGVSSHGIKVYMIENTPSIGGMMARLDKTFPTNDCSICIEAPQMFDLENNDGIEIFVNTEIKKVKKTNFGFNIKLLKKPLFIDEKLCTGCRACIDACPVSLLDVLDGKIGGKKKLISMEFPQAMPNIVSISTLCRYGNMISKGGCIGNCTVDCSQCRECSIALCKQVCEKEGKNAVLLWQSARMINVSVSSIIVATGISASYPTLKTLGYNVFDNVITNMEFERLMNAAGPTSGMIIRPSDGKLATNIAWIQCVNRSYLNNDNISYCSRICCMIACKQAIITKEHNSQISTSIYYNDVKSYGKNFWLFYKKSINKGVKWLQYRPFILSENLNTKNISLKYGGISTGKIIYKEFDLLVLSTGLLPNKNNEEVSKILNIDLDEYGFFKQKDFFLAPLETNVEGIYLCGGSIGPVDISESVSQANAAAMKSVLKANS